jgi:hypothetical protein
MERGDSSRGSRASEEVDGSPEAHRRRTDDRAFTGSGRVLNTDGLSVGGLLRIAAMAWASPSEPVVKEAEERVPWPRTLRRGRTPSSSSLRTPITMALVHSLFFLLLLVSFVLSFDRNGVFSSEATAELERLRAAADAFLDFLGVAPVKVHQAL